MTVLGNSDHNERLPRQFFRFWNIPTVTQVFNLSCKIVTRRPHPAGVQMGTVLPLRTQISHLLLVRLLLLIAAQQ